MSFYNNLQNQAHVSGIIGGLLSEPLVLVLPVSFWQHIGMTVLTTTISFGLPYLYKWLMKKYFNNNEIRSKKY
jgi:hypothetical protein